MNPDVQIGGDQPYPPIHEDTTLPEQGSHLKLNQHVLDQPPYNQLHTILPRKFFERPKGKITQKGGLYLFLRFLGNWKYSHPGPIPTTPESFGYVERHMNFNQWKRFVNPEHINRHTSEEILTYFRSVESALLPYPYVYQYLRDKTDGSSPDGSPKVPKPLAKWYRPEMTFAAYQHAMVLGERISQHIGLKEIRPQGYSRKDDVREIPQQASHRDVLYRVLMTSEAVK